MAFVEYFLFERNLKTVLAVVKHIILDLEKPFLFCDKPQLPLRIAGEDESYTVVAVDCILEKIICFSGSPRHIIMCGWGSKFLWSLSIKFLALIGKVTY